MVLRFREVAESGANNQLGYSAAIYDISYILRVCFELWIYQVAGLGANSQLGHSAKCSAGGAANCLHSYKHTIHTFYTLEKKKYFTTTTCSLQACHTISSQEKKCAKNEKYSTAKSLPYPLFSWEKMWKNKKYSAITCLYSYMDTPSLHWSRLCLNYDLFYCLYGRVHCVEKVPWAHSLLLTLTNGYHCPLMPDKGS